MARDTGELVDETTEYGTWAERRVQSLLHACGYCPISLDLVRAHLGDLRRARLAETPFSGSSH